MESLHSNNTEVRYSDMKLSELKYRKNTRNYKNVSAEVLLLPNSKTEPVLRDSQEPLKEVLPKF